MRLEKPKHIAVVSREEKVKKMNDSNRLKAQDLIKKSISDAIHNYYGPSNG